MWDREMGKWCLFVSVGCRGHRASVIVTVTCSLSRRRTIAIGGHNVMTETTEVFLIHFTKACVVFLIFRPFKSPLVLVMPFF